MVVSSEPVEGFPGPEYPIDRGSFEFTRIPFVLMNVSSMDPVDYVVVQQREGDRQQSRGREQSVDACWAACPAKRGGFRVDKECSATESFCSSGSHRVIDPSAPQKCDRAAWCRLLVAISCALGTALHGHHGNKLILTSTVMSRQLVADQRP